MTLKRIIFLLLCFTLFLNSSCVPSSEGNITAVIELFNGIWINRAHTYNDLMPEIDKELGRNKVTFIQYYVDSKDDHPFPRLSCDESEERMIYYMKDKGLPTAFFNGGSCLMGIPGGDTPKLRVEALKKIILDNVSIINSTAAPIKLSGACYNEEKDSYLIEVKIEALQDIDFKDIKLFYALTENNIPFAAINGDKIHHFVFREFLRSKDEKDKIVIPGIPLKLSKKGDKLETSISFDINSKLYINELNVVVFVQDTVSKLIIQGIEIPIRNGYKKD
jgi:hypothetical protein